MKLKILKTINWILLGFIALFIALTFNFFLNAFVLIFLIPLYLLVNSRVKASTIDTSDFTYRSSPIIKKILIVVLIIAVVIYAGFVLFFTLP